MIKQGSKVMIDAGHDWERPGIVSQVGMYSASVQFPNPNDPSTPFEETIDLERILPTDLSQIMSPAKFKAARLALGLSQAKIAPLLGFSRVMSVSDIERGVVAPSGSVVLLMQAFLDGYRPHNWPN